MISTDCTTTLLNIGKIFGPSMLSALVAFFLFWLTSRRDRKKDKKKKKQEYKNRLLFIIKLAKMTKGACEHQFKAFKDYAGKIKGQPVDTHQVIICDTTTLDRLFKIVGEELTFQSFVNLKIDGNTDNAINSYANFSVTVDYLYGLHGNITTSIDGKHKDQTQLINTYADRVTKLSHDIVAFRIKLQSYNPSSAEGVFYNESIRIQSTNDSNKGVYANYNKFLLPFIELCYLTLSKSIKETDALYDIVRGAEELKVIYLNIYNASLRHLDFVIKSADQFKEAIDNLDERIKLLRVEEIEV